MEMAPGTAGTQPPTRQKPHARAIWYASKPPGTITWEGPGWYMLALKNTRLIRVG